MRINKNTLESLIAERQLQLTEVAERAGISRQGLYRIISEGKCRYATCGKLARALGVTFFDLTEGVNDIEA